MTCENCVHKRVCVIKAFPDMFENTRWGKDPCDHFVKVSGWISVDERLPEYGGSILIHTIEDTFRIAWRDNDNCYISGLTLYEPEGVDYWMPLPERPKGD